MSFARRRPRKEEGKTPFYSPNVLFAALMVVLLGIGVQKLTSIIGGNGSPQSEPATEMVDKLRLQYNQNKFLGPCFYSKSLIGSLPNSWCELGTSVGLLEGQPGLQKGFQGSVKKNCTFDMLNSGACREKSEISVIFAVKGDISEIDESLTVLIARAREVKIREIIVVVAGGHRVYEISKLMDHFRDRTNVEYTISEYTSSVRCCFSVFSSEYFFAVMSYESIFLIVLHPCLPSLQTMLPAAYNHGAAIAKGDYLLFAHNKL